MTQRVSDERLAELRESVFMGEREPIGELGPDDAAAVLDAAIDARAEVERLKAERRALVERAVRVGYEASGVEWFKESVARVLAEGEK